MYSVHCTVHIQYTYVYIHENERLLRVNTIKKGRYTEYTECQAFSPVVRIGAPPLPPHLPASVALPPFGSGWGGGGIQTKGQTNLVL